MNLQIQIDEIVVAGAPQFTESEELEAAFGDELSRLFERLAASAARHLEDQPLIEIDQGTPLEFSSPQAFGASLARAVFTGLVDGSGQKSGQRP